MAAEKNRRGICEVYTHFYHQDNRYVRVWVGSYYMCVWNL